MRLLDFSPLILSMLPSGPGTPAGYQGFLHPRYFHESKV